MASRKPTAKGAAKPKAAAEGGIDPTPEAEPEAEGDPISSVLGHSTRLGPLLAAARPGSKHRYVSSSVAMGLRAAAFLAPDAHGPAGTHRLVDATGLLLGTLAIRRMSRGTWIAPFLEVLAGAGLRPADRPEIRRMDLSSPHHRADAPLVKTALLRWDAVKLIAEASALRRETNPWNETIGLRHIWFAPLFSAEGQAALDSLGLLDDGLGPLVEALAEMVGAHRVRKYSESYRAWRPVIERARAQELFVRTRKLRSGFSPDIVADDGPGAQGAPASDPLGTRADAVALADLILLDAAKPPLAIGLLGSWGSGKSTLMWRLRQEIRRQVERRQGRDEAVDRDPATRRVGNVAQLTFNAWSFADSKNLWASLTAEIFEQLKAGGGEAIPVARGAALVEEVADKLSAQEEAAGSEPSSGNLQKELDELESSARKTSIEAERLQVHAVAVGSLISGGSTAVEDRLRKALPGKAEAIAMDAHGRGLGRAWWLAKRMYPPWLRHAAIAAPFVLVAGIAALVLVPDLRIALAAAGGALALVAGLVGKPIVTALATAAQYDELVHRRKVALAEKAAELQGQVEAKRGELDRARRSEAKRAVTVATLAETKGHPARLLQYLLSDSADIQSIKAQVGLMATVRRCFETLDELIGQQCALAAQGQPAAAKGSKPPRSGEKPPLERIVLYIDDLDRCSAQQVVQILEAVHLLLAFKCFVVVVAIDARWLHRSLLISHPQFQSLAADAAPRPSKSEGTIDGEPPSPIDYLEKIFQIPFWVRPLTPPAFPHRAATPQEAVSPPPPPESAYTRYLDELMGKPASSAVSDGAESGGGSDAGGGEPQDGAPLKFVSEPPAATEADDSGARIERVAFTDEERMLLAELGPLAAKSPRAIKRLVNIYRLIKAGVPPAQAEAFRGKGSDGTASYASVLFALALDAGLDASSVAMIRAAIRQGMLASPLVATSRMQARAAELLNNDSTLVSRSPFDDAVRRLAATGHIPAFAAAVIGLRRAFGGEPPPEDDLERAFVTTQRYSFRAS